TAAKKTAAKKTATRRPAPTRGRLMSMRVSDGFRDFVLDHLQGVQDFRAKSMFGGLGLYSGELFFGMVAADVVYFKVDDRNRAVYEQAGAKAFKPYPDRPMAMAYYSVPTTTLEQPASLIEWVNLAIAVARDSKRNK